jgi:hypothetical protein
MMVTVIFTPLFGNVIDLLALIQNHILITQSIIGSFISTLVRCGYKNTIILDHTPPFVEEAGPGC